MFFHLGALVQEGEGGVEAISLGGSDEVGEVEIVPIFPCCDCVEVQLPNLQVAFDGEPELHVLATPVDRSLLDEEVLHFVNRKVPLVILEFPGEATSQNATDPFFGGKVLIKDKSHGKVEVTMLLLIEYPQILVDLGHHSGAVDFICEVERGPDQFLGLFDGDEGRTVVFNRFNGGDLSVDSEEVVLSVVVHLVVETFHVVKEWLVTHYLHQLAESLGAGPVTTVVLQGDDEL